MKELIRNSLLLFAITVVAVLCLSFVYEFTKDSRKVEEDRAKQDSYKEVFTDAMSFSQYGYDNDLLVEYLDAHFLFRKGSCYR